MLVLHIRRGTSEQLFGEDLLVLEAERLRDKTFQGQGF